MDGLNAASQVGLVRRATGFGVVLCGLTLAAGCASAVSKPASAPLTGVSASVAVSATARHIPPELDASRSVVLDAYRRFWSVALGVEELPLRQWRGALARVAVDPLLTRVYEGLRSESAAGDRQYGSVVPHPAVVDLRDGRAAILDCQDASRSGVADATTGLPTTVGDARTPVAATLVRGNDGVWRLSEARYMPGPC